MATLGAVNFAEPQRLEVHRGPDMIRMKTKMAMLLCLPALPVVAGCVSDDHPYGRRPDFSRNDYGSPEQRDRAREEWQGQQARRDEIDRREESAYREA